MRRAAAIFGTILLGACTEGTVHSGTAVGNPPDTLFRTNPGVPVSKATLKGATLIEAPCDLALPVSAYPLGDVDLLSSPAVNLTGDAPCGLAIQADSLQLIGGETVDIELEGVEIALGRSDGWVRADFERQVHFVLELGSPGWLADLALDHLLVGPAEPDASVLLGALEATSGMYADIDHDGIISPDERAAAHMGAWEAPEREPETEDED